MNKKILLLIFLLIWIGNTYSDCSFWICEISEGLKLTEEKDIISSVTPTLMYLFSFIWFFWVAFAIKGWFEMMIASWDDEKFKKWKRTLIFSLVWLFIILTTYTIISVVFNSLEYISKK